MTVEEYEKEPREAIDWDLQFARLEAEMEADAVKKAQRNRG